MKFSDIFPWDEFYERFTLWHEEFLFIYKNKEINISYVSENSTALAYGSKEEGYVCMDFKSPEAFIQASIFDGESIYDIWDELS